MALLLPKKVGDIDTLRGRGQRHADLSSTGSEPWPNENTEKSGGLDLLHLTLMKMVVPQVLSDKRKDPSLNAGR